MANPNPNAITLAVVNNGPQHVEDFSYLGERSGPDRSIDSPWEIEWTGVVATSARPVIVKTYPDDGIMGGRYAHLYDDGPGWNRALRVFHDATKPALWRFTIRHHGAKEGNGFVGAVLYHGECSYDGMTSARSPPNFYGIPIPYTVDTPIDCEMRWEPVGRHLYGRYRIRTGGVETAWSAWAESANTAARDGLWYGPGLWFGITDSDGMDIGRIQVFGEPAWGATDHIGFSRWLFTGDCGWYAGADAVGRIGGVCHRGTGVTNTLLGFGGQNGEALELEILPTGALWGPGYSETFTPSENVTGYRALRIVVPKWDVGEGSYVSVQVRDADTDALLPDDQVPGNSTGIVSTATSMEAQLPSPAVANWVRDVDISGIPPATRIYLEVRGKTRSTPAWRRETPRLGAAYILVNHSEPTYMPPSQPMVYANAHLLAPKKLIDFVNDDIRLLLVSSAYVPNLDTHVYVSHLTGEIVANGGSRQALTGKSVALVGSGEAARARFLANATEWPAGPADLVYAYAIMYLNTGNDATSPLIAYIDADVSAATKMTVAGSKARIAPPATGWLLF